MILIDTESPVFIAGILASVSLNMALMAIVLILI